MQLLEKPREVFYSKNTTVKEQTLSFPASLYIVPRQEDKDHLYPPSPRGKHSKFPFSIKRLSITCKVMSLKLEHAQNLPGGPVKCRLLRPPPRWVSDSTGPGWEILASSQVMLLLLVWGPNCENHRSQGSRHRHAP